MTFEREIMSAVCLGVVWVNTLLICAHASGQFSRLSRLRRKMKPAAPGQVGVVKGGFVAGAVASGQASGLDESTRGEASRLGGSAPGGSALDASLHAQSGVGLFVSDQVSVLAPTFSLMQTARSRGDGKIYFHDQDTRCAIPRGHLQVDGTLGGSSGPPTRLEVRPEGADHTWVWPTTQAVRAELACSGVEEFDALAKPALQGKGTPRAIELSIPADVELFVFGALSEDARAITPAVVSNDELSIASAALPPSLGPRPRASRSAEGSSAQPAQRRIVLISSEHPAEVIARSQRLIVLVVACVLVFGAGLTALALQPPAFGTLSKWGAFGLLVFLLLVQPIGVWLTERVLLPHEAIFGGTWVRSRLAGNVSSSRARSQLSAG